MKIKRPIEEFKKKIGKLYGDKLKKILHILLKDVLLLDHYVW